MKSPIDNTYFDRQIRLNGFGRAGQEALSSARVLVVGAGGLGCPLLQYLATAGVGVLGIADGDTVSKSNLHRQILYTDADLGRSKAETAAEKLHLLQPSLELHAYPFALNSRNILALLGDYDVVVDGSDNFETRYLVNDACVILGKPLVSGAVGDYSGQLSVFNYQGGPTYRCLYPEAPAEEDCLSCSIHGILNVLPGIVGLHMANETIKVITGYGKVLSGRLLLIDLRGNGFHLFQIEALPENQQITQLPESTSFMLPPELAHYRKLHPESQLVDVREAWEFEEENLGGIHIPLHELADRKEELDLNKPLILLCQTGQRSKMALKILHLEETPGRVMLAKFG